MNVKIVGMYYASKRVGCYTNMQFSPCRTWSNYFGIFTLYKVLDAKWNLTALYRHRISQGEMLTFTPLKPYNDACKLILKYVFRISNLINAVYELCSYVI